MPFTLIRYPDGPSYATPQEALAAVEELDARLPSQPAVVLSIEGCPDQTLSMNDLKEVILEEEIACETSEESVPADPVVEGSDEGVDEVVE